MAMRGKFIAIEGPDASGKGTQHEKLVARFQLNNIQVATVDFPQYETSVFGKIVGNLLAGEYGDYSQYHPVIASLPYAADRWKASSIIEENLEKGVHVLANRFTYSNMAHQSARLPKEQRWDFIRLIDEIEHSKGEGFGIPRPDLAIILDVPSEISRELIKHKMERKYLGDNQADQLEADIHHQVEAANMYRELAVSLPNITLINCCNSEGNLMSKDEIHHLVWQETSRFLRYEIVEGQISRERES